jgi:hypothetical protein
VDAVDQELTHQPPPSNITIIEWNQNTLIEGQCRRGTALCNPSHTDTHTHKHTKNKISCLVLACKLVSASLLARRIRCDLCSFVLEIIQTYTASFFFYCGVNGSRAVHARMKSACEKDTGGLGCAHRVMSALASLFTSMRLSEGWEMLEPPYAIVGVAEPTNGPNPQPSTNAMRTSASCSASITASMHRF